MSVISTEFIEPTGRCHGQTEVDAVKAAKIIMYSFQTQINCRKFFDY
jgi:hypothetical protein